MPIHKLGLVTIGQSPREDIWREVVPHVGAAVDVVEAGALDGMTATEIEGLAPQGDESLLVTRLTDGRQAVIGETAIVPYLEQAVARLESAGVYLTLILCTGSFPRVRHRRPLLAAGPLLTSGVAAVTTSLRVGILCPDHHQTQAMEEKWQQAGVRPIGVWAASPYGESEATLEQLATDIKGVDVLVLDCMGYTSSMAAAVARGARVPALLARHVVGRLAGLLLT